MERFGVWGQFLDTLPELLTLNSKRNWNYILKDRRDYESGNSIRLVLECRAKDDQQFSVGIDMSVRTTVDVVDFQVPQADFVILSGCIYEMICDKLHVFSTEQIGRRIKDMYDLYILSYISDFENKNKKSRETSEMTYAKYKPNAKRYYPEQGYASDLTDSQWEIIKHLFERKNNTGRHLENQEKRKLVNAVPYLNKTGCQWRMLPEDFPGYQTAASFYCRAIAGGLWDRINVLPVQKSRGQASRDPDPAYALIDSQSVKTTGAA